ncbi:MAG: hypothetical protein K0S65_5974 [Labilithrix sp.]|nr:hypothetical protein [Labilithrix sp.]
MATSPCPACGANAFVAAASGDGGACSSCGYASGESNRCPHCGAVARIEGSGLASVCAVCGGPRIPSNLGGETTTNALRMQKKALAHARIASVATVLQAFVAGIATLVGLALLPASIAGKALVFAIAIAPLILALRSRSRATAARATAKAAGERAWQAAAEDAASRAEHGVTVNGLAKTLGVEPEHAEKLLTSLAVHDRTRIDVGDDAEVRYSVAAGAGERAFDDLPTEEELADDAGSTGREGRVR